MLSDNRTQGEAIGFAQFMSRNFCREIPNGFSNFWALVINKRLLVQPCPLQTVVIWVTVWVSGFLSKSALTILATKQRKVPKPWWFRNFYGCGGRTRTYDLRVMSPTSFQLLYSAICLVWFLADYNMGAEGCQVFFWMTRFVLAHLEFRHIQVIHRRKWRQTRKDVTTEAEIQV